MSNATDAMSVEKRDGACVANIPNLLDYIEKLEATIAKHERREDSHVKRIEELISAKGIKELEARLAEAEREACAKTIELIIGVDVGWEDADTIRVAAKAIRTRGYQMNSLQFNTENARVYELKKGGE